MGKFYETIPDSLRPWILQQKVFWIASAPLSAEGHVNVSPKGGAYFGVLDEKTFWYMDLTGSGIETTSHLHEPGNGRITVLFNAFEGPPRILRFWGKGNVLEYGSKPFEDFVARHSVQTIPGTRSIIVVDIHQVGTSCGFSVPYYDFKDYRLELNQYFEKRAASDKAGKVHDGIERYWASKNAQSMDGLPGLQRGCENGKRDNVPPIKKMVGHMAPNAPRLSSSRSTDDIIRVAVLSFVAGALMAVYVGSVYLRYVQH